MSSRLAEVQGRGGFCSSFVRAVMRQVLAQQGDASPVWAAMGCEHLSVSDEGEQGGACIAAHQFSTGLQVAAHSLGDSLFGWRIGHAMPLSCLGALGFAAMAAPDGLHALQLLEALPHLFVPEVPLTVTRGPSLTLVQSDVPDEAPRDEQFWLFMLAWLMCVVEAGCGRPVQAVSVVLPCSPPSCARALSALVLVPVRFQSGRFDVAFRVSDLRRPSAHGSTEIFRMMVALARKQARGAVSADEALMARLKHAVSLILDRGGVPTLAAVVAIMPVMDAGAERFSVRQLQRRLAVIKQSFRGLVGEVRRERAIEQLRGTARPLADIAAEAGYAELRSFHRAVRRWTGSTPMRIRSGELARA